MADKIKIFIDGREGTTGLRIDERLSGRDDTEQILIDPELRKDPAARAACINASDVTFLCLPDAASVEAVAMVNNDRTRIIDASTAHRTSPDWAYGLAELTGAREKIALSKRVAVPGCYAGGFVTIVAPLIEKGYLPADAALCCHAISGYSGAGKKAIAQYGENPPELRAPRVYALTQQHKHLREMTQIPGLITPPVFCPIVTSYYSGMIVSVPLHVSQFYHRVTKEDLLEFYRDYYSGARLIGVTDEASSEDGFISAEKFSGRDDLELLITGNADRLVLTARFDNLGKGASGAAIQCFNLMTGADETKGLNLEATK